MGAQVDRTKDHPRKLKTPPGTSEDTMHTDEKDVSAKPMNKARDLSFTPSWRKPS
jgi:hypothetical protein